MMLLERDASLNELHHALQEAAGGEGRIALVSGEAGIGKTSLVDRFARESVERVRVLWGACDALFTPRPLGPLHDMGLQVGGEMERLLEAPAALPVLFASMLTELQRQPTIAIFEDVHWADEATLDLLRFLGRRISRTTSLLIITYRDDEIGPRHPLRSLLGDLASSPAARRLPLRPLSEKAVRALVGGRTMNVPALYRQTRGNPFYVTEVLANEGGGLPPTVRDAVLARAARLSPSGQAVLEAAAVIGPRIEPWLLVDVTGAEASAAEESLSLGMLVTQGDVITFRHEVARQTILEAISPLHRISLHRMTLDALILSPSTRHDLARLAHHAEAAGDRDAVLEYAPAAAREASASRAHRSALSLYELALRFGGSLPPDERATLLEQYAQECDCVDMRVPGLEACREVLAIWRALENPVKEGEAHAHMVNMLIGLGRTSEAMRHSREAIAILETQSSRNELKIAYRNQAFLDMLDQNHHAAIAWAEKDIALAEQDGDTGEVLSARNVIGTAMMFLDFERGRQYMDENLAAARREGRERTTALAYANLSSVACELYHLHDALRYLEEGIAFAADCDLDRLRLYMLAWQSMTLLRLGRWDDAASVTQIIFQQPGVSITSRVTALAAFGSVSARRGDLAARDVLDEALELSSGIENLHRIGLVRAARAEAAWLAGEPRQAAEEARAAYDLALSKRNPWFTGELAFWITRAGDDIPIPDWTAAPYAMHIAGNWRGAAEQWARLGCPYEQARALADGDYEAQTMALTLFEQLGARPAAEQVRQKLRAVSAPVPRGPRPTTRENPFGLTNRQVEVLLLLTKGLSNAAISDRLSISPKTVDHHVSTVLSKLDVHSREDAAALALQQSDFSAK